MEKETVSNLSEAQPFIIQENISLADKNWFKTGGNAEFFAQPRNDAEFQQAILFAKEQNLPVFLLGTGANILISDDGIKGLTIQPEEETPITRQLSVSEIELTASAGMSLEKLIKFCLEKNILGLEEFSGIPSSIGGATYINLHYYNFFLSDFLISAKIISKKNGSIKTVDKSWFSFGYDQSELQKKEYFLLSSTFKLKIGNDLETAYAKGRSTEIKRHRFSRFPTANTCGSFFKNFSKDEVAHTKKQLPFIGYYLDKLGIKGELQIGGAKVSHQHANMIVTENKATSGDVIELARKMQEMVKKEFNLLPQPECQLIGFDEYPLLK